MFRLVVFDFGINIFYLFIVEIDLVGYFLVLYKEKCFVKFVEGGIK